MDSTLTSTLEGLVSDTLVVEMAEIVKIRSAASATEGINAISKPAMIHSSAFFGIEVSVGFISVSPSVARPAFSNGLHSLLKSSSE